MKITLIKQLNNTFKIAYNSDYETAKKIPVNDPIEYEFKKVRNYKFHKKFFALLNLVFENQEQYNNFEHLRKDLIISAGYYDLRFNIEGVEIQEAKSISFAQMDENEFSELYNRIIDVVVKWLGIDKQDIIDNIEQYF
jgi:hypothetical protein